MEKVFHLLGTIYKMTQIPVRYFDNTGDMVLFYQGYEAGNDPLMCDKAFRQSMMMISASEFPVLEIEEDICYGIFCDSFKCKIILGPICLNSMDKAKVEHYARIHNAATEHFYIKRRMLDELCAALANICYSLTGKCVNVYDIASGRLNEDNKPGLSENDYQTYLLENTENDYPRLSFYDEMLFMQKIREGTIDEIRNHNHDNGISVLDESRVGKLAQKSFKQNEYLAVSIIVLASRAAIDGGLDVLTSYLMSDLYLQRLERCERITEVFALMQNVVADYIERVHQNKLNKSKHSYIEQCKNYIACHLNKKFTLDDIAKEIGISKSYIGRRFSESEGMGILQYAGMKRVEAAANMLKYSNESILKISNYLCFASQSHFGKAFKEHMGVTPQKYRETNKTSAF